MKIKFVGTGSGKSSLQRFHSSFLISENKNNLLVDAGDGISRALLSSKINFLSIDAILISHFHPDHFTGIPALLVQMKMLGRVEPISIFVHEAERTFLQRFILNSYLFKERLGFEIRYICFEFEQEVKIRDNFNFIARKNSHFDDYETLSQRYSLPNISASFLFMTEKIKLHYTGDIGGKEDLHLFSDIKPNYLITEITHIPFQAIKELQSVMNYKRIILTHISDELQIEIQRELETVNIFTASDGLEIKIN